MGRLKGEPKMHFSIRFALGAKFRNKFRLTHQHGVCHYLCLVEDPFGDGLDEEWGYIPSGRFKHESSGV